MVLCDDVNVVDVVRRGKFLRNHPSLERGANANFVSRRDGGWEMRTFERGVEDETLACGTGAVATATLLQRWGSEGSEASILTRSGVLLTVSLPSGTETVAPRLRGEGRLLYEGTLSDIPGL